MTVQSSTRLSPSYKPFLQSDVPTLSLTQNNSVLHIAYLTRREVDGSIVLRPATVKNPDSFVNGESIYKHRQIVGVKKEGDEIHVLFHEDHRKELELGVGNPLYIELKEKKTLVGKMFKCSPIAEEKYGIYLKTYEGFLKNVKRTLESAKNTQ